MQAAANGKVPAASEPGVVSSFVGGFKNSVATSWASFNAKPTPGMQKINKTGVPCLREVQRGPGPSLGILHGAGCPCHILRGRGAARGPDVT